MENVKKIRLNYLDIAKGIAIILVALGHADFGDNYLCNWIYSFHIPIFFIISGILLSFKDNWKSESMSNIIIKKAKQLIYPYFTFSTITIAYKIIMALKAGTYTDLWNIILATISLYGYGTLWFLSALFFAEILFIFIYKFCKNKWMHFLLIFIVTTLGAYLLQFEFWNSEYLTMNILYGVLNVIIRSAIASIFIAIGYKFYKFRDFISKYKKYCIIISILIFISNIYICQFNHMVDLHYSKLNNFILYYECSIFTSLSLLIILQYIVKSNKLLEYYGKNSLIIMATHFTLPVLELGQRIVQYMKLPFGVYINGAIACIIVMIVEIVVIEFINRKCKFIIKLK